MLSHDEMIGFQAEKHDLVEHEKFATAEQYVLFLIHTAAYECAARVAEGKSVLDLGCNTGYGTHILSQRASTAVGVDVSWRAIRHADGRYAGGNTSFSVVDGVRLPFEDDTFDVVTSFQVLEHLVEYDSFLGEIKRVLAPGGAVIFTTPNALLRLDPGMKPWYEFHVREFDHEELGTTLRSYFGGVEVLGLYADDPLYSIEVRRVDRARRAARAGQAESSRGTASMFAASKVQLKKMLPAWVVSNLKKVQSPGNRRLLREIKQNNSPQDFRYRDSDLDAALDLLAICSDSNPQPYVDLLTKQVG